MPSLREAREANFLSQRELAEKAKVSRTTLSAIEQGQSRPRPRTARALAAALGVHPREIAWPDATEEDVTRRGNKPSGAGDGDAVLQERTAMADGG